MQEESRLLDRIDEIFTLSFSSPQRNSYFAQAIIRFVSEMEQQYPEVSLKDVPALERLRSGSEVPGPVDKEMKREIESLLEQFLDESERALESL
tara:strand:- start:22 stop:303 length:282 start_codon:yes stop_codon:yes gene_type:complete